MMKDLSTETHGLTFRLLDSVLDTLTPVTWEDYVTKGADATKDSVAATAIKRLKRDVERGKIVKGINLNGGEDLYYCRKEVGAALSSAAVGLALVAIRLGHK